MNSKQGMILFFGIVLILLNFWVQGYFHILWTAVFTGTTSAGKIASGAGAGAPNGPPAIGPISPIAPPVLD